MADSLKDLYNTDSSLLSVFSDPSKIKDLATMVADQELGGEHTSGGKTDALRHLLGAAALGKRQPALAETMLNWHENPNVFQFLGGGYGQRDVERQMDLHNNALGLEIAKKAKNYDEALHMAKQYVREGKVKLAPPEAPTPVSKDIPEHDRNVTFKEWWSKFNSK
jgi:hypothetical protein